MKNVTSQNIQMPKQQRNLWNKNEFSDNKGIPVRDKKSGNPGIMRYIELLQWTPRVLFNKYEKGGCRTNVRQLILYIQHKTPSFEKPGVRGIISLCD